MAENKELKETSHFFGVSGFISIEGEVLYSNFFTTAHLGRVCDIFVERLKKIGIDEFKVRNFIIPSIYQSYLSQYSKNDVLKIFEKKENDSLLEPITLECGIDLDKIVLGVSFNLGSDAFINFENLVERISQKSSIDSFEEFLINLDKNSDQIILKFHPETRRFEIISILMIGNKSSKKTIEVIVFGNDISIDSVQPRKYSDLLETRSNHPLVEEKDFRISGFNEDLIDQKMFFLEKDKNLEKNIFVENKKSGFFSKFGAAVSNIFKEKDLKLDPENSITVSNNVSIQNEEIINKKIDLVESAEQLAIIQNDFQQIFKKDKSYQNESWVDSLVSSWIKEKYELKNAKKQIEIDIQAKENDCQNKIKLIEKESSRMTTLLKLKESLLEHTKKQLQVVSKKFEMMTENQVSEVAADIELKNNYEKMVKLNEDLKKTNRKIVNQLLESSNQKNFVQGDVGELTQRLEAAMKLSVNYKKQIDSLKIVVNKSLKRENEVMMELENLKKINP